MAYKILVAPWGSPEKWENVEYEFDDIKVTSRSSLKPLVEILKPEEVVLIVLDTRVTEKFENYEHLCQNVRSRYVEFCDEELHLPIKDKNIIVAPGVGTFQVKDLGVAKFEGRATDFYYLVAFELAKRIIEAVKEEGLEVHLDLTHGINFMPTLVYRALYEILGVMAYVCNIKLNVYNSEPYSKGITQKLRIHRIESREILPRLSSHILGKDDGRAWLIKKSDETIELRGKALEKNETDELNAFLSAIVNGLPLALYTFFPQEEELGRKLEEACEYWRNHIECAQGYVKRRLKFEADFLRCVRLWIAAKVFAERLKIQKKEEISLDELYKTSQKLFRQEGTKMALINRALMEEIKNEAGQKAKEEWKSVKELVDKKVGKLSLQNFLAHAGLEYNVTELKREGEELKLRYSQEEKGEVIKFCLGGLFNPD
jgi:CRISPR-associated protein Csx1